MIFGPSCCDILATALVPTPDVSNFSWIKIQSTSETVYEAFNFGLKLLCVLSKQLA